MVSNGQFEPPLVTVEGQAQDTQCNGPAMSGQDGKPPIPGAVFPPGTPSGFGKGFKIPKTKKQHQTSETSSVEAPARPTERRSDERVNAATNEDSEPFTVVSRKKKGKAQVTQSMKPAEKGSQPEVRAKAASHRSTVPDELRLMWQKEKRCLGCGSERHFIRACPAVPQRRQPAQSAATKTNAPARDSQSKATAVKPKVSQTKEQTVTKATEKPEVGVKRKRDSAQSGQTPPPKKPVYKKHSYASVSATAVEFAIVTKGEAHISRKEFENVRKAVDDEWFSQFMNGDPSFTVETWQYSSVLAMFSVPDDISVKQVTEIVNKSGLLAIPKAKLLEKRRPTTILTGLVTGPAAKRDKAVLSRVIEHQKTKHKIRGRLEIYDGFGVVKSGNLLLKLLADDVAMEDLQRIDFELHFGASGKVKFTDETADKKITPESRKRRLKELEASLDEHRKRAQEILPKKRELEKLLDEPLESVGSCGMGSLSVEDADMEESTEKTGE